MAYLNLYLSICLSIYICLSIHLSVSFFSLRSGLNPLCSIGTVSGDYTLRQLTAVEKHCSRIQNSLWFEHTSNLLAMSFKFFVCFS
jgi:hypothetical protein